MDAKKAVLAALILVIGIGGIVSGAILLNRNTELRESAAVPGGRASVNLLPDTGSYDVGDSFPVSIYFNTDGVPISGLSVRLTYPFSGANPEVVASDVTINPSLDGDPDWSCPTSNVSEVNGNINVNVACANIGAAGFSSTSDTLLATFNLTIERSPAASPFTIVVDPISTITQKSNGEDILATETTGPVATYVVGSAIVPTSPPTTASPTSASTTITPSPSVTRTLTATPSLTRVPTLTSSATGSSTLPDAGVSFPTFAALAAGMLAVFVSLALAL